MNYAYIAIALVGLVAVTSGCLDDGEAPGEDFEGEPAPPPEEESGEEPQPEDEFEEEPAPEDDFGDDPIE